MRRFKTGLCEFVCHHLGRAIVFENTVAATKTVSSDFSSRRPVNERRGTLKLGLVNGICQSQLAWRFHPAKSKFVLRSVSQARVSDAKDAEHSQVVLTQSCFLLAIMLRFT